nr:biopolymer transporter ExbD [Pararhodobacter sp. SW119]
MAAIRPTPALISLVPLVDVLLIMLVFFMVTSTYLDLDVIPAAERAEDAAAPAPATAPGSPTMLLIRLAPDGAVWLRGQRLDPPGLRAALDAHRQAGPEAAVSLLASPRADMQALVGVLDAAAAAGLTRLRILRTEEAP